MKLVEQRKLFFKEGNSDKVYEIDLCEVGDFAFVVNFRYGRRGANLREGTKTESPVPEAKARAIFDKLVAEKEAKGYSANPQAAKPPTMEAPTSSSTPVAQALLTSLAKGERGPRPLGRIVWRVGELALRDAEPLLLELLSQSKAQKDPVFAYSLIWALARCGTTASIEPLQRFQQQKKPPPHIEALLAEALRSVGSDALARELGADELAKMSQPLRQAVTDGDGKAAETILQTALRRNDASFADGLLAMYRYNDPGTRSAMLRLLTEVPLQRGPFETVRAIFKLAEHRRDARAFGILAHRFETSRANPSGWYDKDQVFKIPTRRYLRRRVARTLRRLGLDASPDFVPMAVGVLLPFTDADASTPRGGQYTAWWDTYANYWAFNTLLYSNSDRYEPDQGGNAWRCREGYVPGANAPATTRREEAFPELWDARPEALLQLIDESRCEPVHEMAVGVLRANPAFCAGLETDALTLFLKAPYIVSAKLGLELIKSRPMTGELAWILVDCPLPEAREHAHAWLRTRVPSPYDDAALWAFLILSHHKDNQDFAKSALGSSLGSEQLAQQVIARVLAGLKGLSAEEPHLREIGDILLSAFSRQARSLGEEVLRDLLAHELLVVQEVGAKLLLENDRLSLEVPEDLLIALMDSEHASIRLIGTKLLDKKPDFELAKHPELFVHLALHELADLRLGSRATIERLAQYDDDFAKALASALSEALSRALPKGAPADAVILLRGALRKHLPVAEKSHAMRLLKAKSPHARELGALYLERLAPEELSLYDIVTLANHEMLSVRQAAWALCEASVDRFRATMPAVARLLDASWQDTREFGLAFVQTRFASDDLGPAALIAICDSVRPDIQQYGQKLILEHFKGEDGQEYLAKLSEHPSTKLQLFVTNYLERYACDDVTKLEALSPYFLRVLSGVSRGGVAKRRVLRFLSAEGLKSKAAAEVVARILSRQSVTMAIGNKASIIAAMVAIAETYPEIDLPIRFVPPEARHAV